jgi:hypothetical protein
MIKKSFDHYLQKFAIKASLLKEYQNKTSLFPLALESALEEKAIKAWRALWFINHILSPSVEEALLNVYPQLIKRLEENDASLQRELLKLTQNISLPEEWESYLFDQAQKT